MLWVGIVIAVALLLLLASRGRRERHRDSVAQLRVQFSRIARMRLIAACPGLEDVLDVTSLRMIFDWMLIEMYRRTGATDLDELMRWSVRHGQAESERLAGEVSRQAVERLPQPALATIDECRGRMFAAVIIDEALTEAGKRASPGLKSRP